MKTPNIKEALNHKVWVLEWHEIVWNIYAINRKAGWAIFQSYEGAGGFFLGEFYEEIDRDCEEKLWYENTYIQEDQ